ncbi:MAG: thiol:disulfide interchange protein DsbA/DsbL [Ketobacter sp.]|uniref:thiol:disulfide interchange protein DsbA/DsbL n=1 Tax=Ketobacter sp. MCCC 1A13808 TaxID=2602738 RepID=UPI0018DC93F0|nr:thiol:disulfide interchange protein DsbA/DsbL [Ketobacter sp. MCCC 1A13808]
MKLVKQVFSLVMLAGMVLSLSSQAQAFSMERFVEGVHYKKIEKAPRQEKTVVEYFSYGCPHCNHLEPVLEAWLTDMPEGITFKRVPAIWNKSFYVLAQLYYSLAEVGKEKELTPKVFDYLHTQKKTIPGEAEALQFAGDLGVDTNAFDKAWKSEQVKQNLIKASEEFVVHQVKGVPAIVVNGQYQTSVSMAGSNEELFDVVEFLLNK